MWRSKQLPMVVARLLRKMSKYPRQPRVFSQGPLHGTVIGISAFVLLLGAWTGITDNGPDADSNRGLGYIFGVLAVFATLTSLYFVFRKFGVDEEKVWCSFGRYRYREVRFDQIDRFTVSFQQFRLWSNGKKINIDTNRFDFVLVNLRLIEESTRRRFELPGAPVDSPRWEQEANVWRGIWKSEIMADHHKYYEAHPDEKAYLDSLAPDSQTASQWTL